MQTFNKGEWSEIYTILYLLANPNLNIVDSNMNLLTTELYNIKKIIFNSSEKLEYCIEKDKIILFLDNKHSFNFDLSNIKENSSKLLHKILNTTTKTGSFEIPEIYDFLKIFTYNHKLKSSSQNKADILLRLFDNKLLLSQDLFYSVKSSLGSPATILNSSQNTNFEYYIENLNPKYINEINSINSKTKLLDRIKKINELGGKIIFNRVTSKSFEYNLQLIDSNLPSYLGNALLYSYEKNNKNLAEIFYLANNFTDKTFSDKKLADFLNGTSFGFMPGTKWNGENSVTGGLLIILHDGKIVCLDLIYYKKEVDRYLINNTKLDTPSSSRYHMLELKKYNNRIYFTLNLQVRYK